MTETAHNGHSAGGYEKKDVNVRFVLLVSAAVVVIVVLSLFWVDQWVTRLNEQAVYENMLQPANPVLVELQALESSNLAAYRVLDSTKGVYQIPIDSAMALVVEQYKTNQVAPVSPVGTRQRNPR
ncbi:MAG: hypothetical protein HY851_10285 [candidate division Zixibacteria bacterium]|nr:hypothetical protein [candidate division Zixibacteria bacterium]